ncbi:hypothetical protein [Paraburkholderia strydomiana]|uniref:Uncharacterized protein n=1 Tax=Paraburkholderia strydomiana TaxID=1245417 RepID=A0ABW9BUD2_9BURK
MATDNIAWTKGKLEDLHRTEAQPRVHAFCLDNARPSWLWNMGIA